MPAARVVGKYYNFLRVVVREGFSRDLADELLKALRDAVAFFEKNPPAQAQAPSPAFAH